MQEFRKQLSGMWICPQYLMTYSKKNFDFTMDLDKDLLRQDCIEQKVIFPVKLDGSYTYVIERHIFSWCYRFSSKSPIWLEQEMDCLPRLTLRREKLSVSEVANTIFIQSVFFFQRFDLIRAGLMWGEVFCWDDCKGSQ